MTKITESEIEKFTIELLEKSVYQYIYAPSIAPDSETPERESFEDVLLVERLRTAVGRINPTIPPDIREDAIKQIRRLNSPELIANNEAFHRMLTEGIKVSYQKKGHSRGDLVWLVDFKNSENNDFLVANQFTVIENNVNKRPDVVLFVNGLPLVVIELKNPVDENATVKSAFKQLQTHKQAIARVNRVYKDKPGGLIVDYLGIASDLKKALSFYSDSGGKGDPAIAQEKAVQMMLEKLEVVSQMFHRFAYEEYFEADTGKKLSLILAAEEHILGLENGKKRYINEVTALSRAFSIAIPHEQAMDVKDEVSFFQAVKSRLAKFDSTGAGKTDEEMETAIRQVIDKALVTEQVIDVFDAAGIKKSDISILSEEFLLEVKNMEHKNIALEVLKKLLNDEIRARIKKNLIQGKSQKQLD